MIEPVRLSHEQCSTGFCRLISSHIILVILPVEHYSFYQPSIIHSTSRTLPLSSMRQGAHAKKKLFVYSSRVFFFFRRLFFAVCTLATPRARTSLARSARARAVDRRRQRAAGRPANRRAVAGSWPVAPGGRIRGNGSPSIIQRRKIQ
jgi:hypothetical protein